MTFGAPMDIERMCIVEQITPKLHKVSFIVLKQQLLFQRIDKSNRT